MSNRKGQSGTNPTDYGMWGITKMKYASATGYYVRYTHGGMRTAKFFNAKEGWDRALRAAKDYRDQLLAKAPAEVRARACRGRRRPTEKHPQYPAVRKITHCGREYWAIPMKTATGNPSYRKFSIRRFGDEEAARLAHQAWEKLQTQKS